VIRLLVATTNPHKVREIRQLLSRAGVDIVTLDGWPDLAAPEETGATFEDNARAKALYYGAATGELTVAEDSGLSIDALDGAPGVESARFGGVDLPYPEKFALIDAALRVKGERESAARFVCALALVRDGRVLFETRDRRGPHLAGAARCRRLRLRPDFFLSAVRLHARRSGGRQGGRQPSRRGVSRAAGLPPVPFLNASNPTPGTLRLHTAENLGKTAPRCGLQLAMQLAISNQHLPI
jgi:non-canonical purine NTP pyrophosphatase (RdgB/HAM1 family)